MILDELKTPKIQLVNNDMILDWSKVWPSTRNYLSFLYERFHQDRILLHSGHLSFVTLLSMVPLVTVIFSAFSIFPVFQDWRGEVEVFVFKNFVPSFGEAIQEHLFGFVQNASKMTPIGILVLIFVALMLIASIDRTLNHIWRVKKNRRLVVSFSVYWVVLTLGPVLIGTSLVVTSYLISISGLGGSELIEFRSRLLKMLPLMASFLSFLLLYMLVPNTHVHFRSAFVGALVAAMLFELSKSSFAFYFTHFPVYQAIYGALALIPLLFIWVFVSWVVILVGAEIASSLEAFMKQLHEEPGISKVLDSSSRQS